MTQRIWDWLVFSCRLRPYSLALVVFLAAAAAFPFFSLLVRILAGFVAFIMAAMLGQDQL